MDYERGRRSGVPSGPPSGSAAETAISTDLTGHDGWANPDRPEQLPYLRGRLLLISRRLSLAVCVLGVAVLLGYCFRSSHIVKLWPSLPPMYPNAALGFVFGGVGLQLAVSSGGKRRSCGALGGVLLAGIGTISLLLRLARVGPTWFEGLWPAQPFVAATTPVPGRPVAETSIAFVILGAAGVLTALRRNPRLAQALALSALSVGLAAILGYVLGVNRVRLGSTLGGAVGMALHTALGITALGLAALIARPGEGLVAQLTSAGPGGRISRRLVGMALLTPLAFIGIGVFLREVLADELLAGSIAAVLQAGLLGFVTLVPAAGIDRFDDHVRQAVRLVRSRQESVGEQHVVIRAIAEELVFDPPSPPGWTVAVAREQATGELGGDTVQLLVEQDRMLLAFFDLAGHGSVAGLNAYRFRREIAALWHHHIPPTEIMNRLNQSAVELETIATGVLIEIQPSTGETTAVIAGHQPPLHLHHGELTSWQRTGPLLGVPTAEFHQRRYHLAPSDLLVVYSDGLTEARPLHGEPLGDERLIGLVRTFAQEHPAQLVGLCLDAARDHTHARLLDDALICALLRQ